MMIMPIIITPISMVPIRMTPLLHASRSRLRRPTTLQHHPRHAQNPNPLPTNPTPAPSRLERLDNKTGTPPRHGRAASLAADISPPRPRPEPAAAAERGGESAHTGSPRHDGPHTPQDLEHPNAHAPLTGPTPNACHSKRQAPSLRHPRRRPKRPGSLAARSCDRSPRRASLRKPRRRVAGSASERLPRPAPGRHGPSPGASHLPARHSTHATPRRLK